MKTIALILSLSLCTITDAQERELKPAEIIAKSKSAYQQCKTYTDTGFLTAWVFMESGITREGLGELAKLKLTRLAIENGDRFSPETFAVIGEIGTLESLHLYPAKRSVEDYDASKKAYEALLPKVRESLPDLEVTWQDPPKSGN